MKKTTQEAVNKLKIIIAKCQAGADYETSKLEAQPYLDIINKEGVKLATKFGKKHKPFTFTYLAR